MKKRIITGILGGALFLLITFLGGYWFTALVFLIASLAYYELIRMNQRKFFDWPGIVGMVLLWLALFPDLIWNQDFIRGDIIFLFIFLFLFLTVASKNRIEYKQAAYFFLSSMYLGIAFHYLLETRLNYGFGVTMTIIAGIWATDTGALFFGKKFGKRKLWPAISPNKTIEGSLGGALFAIIIVALISYFANITAFLPLSTAILIGLVIAIGGQLGDLMESAVKRSLHVKDSGDILPGHGGIYDRFDSMIVVFPILYLVQLLSL